MCLSKIKIDDEIKFNNFKYKKKNNLEELSSITLSFQKQKKKK